MKLRVGFLSSLYISLLCASVSGSALAAQAEKPERWFEIEVILFKQLGNNGVLKEQFPDNISSVSVPQNKKHFDLLTPYIQPNLSGVKQFLPLCIDEESNIYLESLQEVNTPLSNALKAISHLDSLSIPEVTSNQVELNNYQHLPSSDNSYKALMTQRKASFDLHNKELASPLFSTQSICIIRRIELEGLLSDEQLVNLQVDSFNVEALPSKLNASGAHLSDSPYLIANESLLLADIKQRLQWSKEFQPLLHFGWRQVGVTRDKAIPLKLFAGEHLNNQYQQALSDYQYKINEAKQTEQFVSQEFNSFEQETVDAKTSEVEKEKHSKEQYAVIKQQKITQLFNELNIIDSSNINNLISDIEQQTVEELIVSNEKSQDEGDLLNIATPPLVPIQPWFLDGFFKVHLDHYLYITADFNVLSQSLDKSINDVTDKTNMKVINFSQNKRAITGEIHYFDHPYIGMIVQIRRFDPSKPKDEAVSQVINN
jgi:hypothetical protein